MACLRLSAVILLCLQLLPCLSMANINLGSYLSTDNGNSSWLSPSEVFAFGFRQLNHSDLFLLAIWFNKIPEKTVVWYADGDNPAPRGSKVDLTTDGLLLKDPRGQTIWRASPSTKVSDGASMLDTGNFVLIGNGSNYVWQSFENFRDTILPTQRLNLGSVLVSKLTETNFSKGRFELHFTNGSLILYPVAWPTPFIYKEYYNSNTYSANSSESGHQLVFEKSGNIYIEKTNNETVPLPQWNKITPTVEQYYRATLDYDGVFTEYAYGMNSEAKESWMPLEMIPDDICNDIRSEIGSGACGFNSYCSIEDGRPNCDCPDRYVPVDPSYKFSGCKPDFLLGCGADDGSRDPEELYEMKEFNNVNWPLGDYERLKPYSQTECEKSCLHDCSCAVVIYDGTGCWKKKLPLSNGKYPDDSYSKALFKIRKVDSSHNSSSKKERTIIIRALLIGFSLLIFNVILFVAIHLVVFLRNKRKDGNNVKDSSVSDANLRFFTYKELNEATGGFQEELGRGSFGIVYKGLLRSGSRNAVAVKKLDKLAEEREREFKTEVSAIGRTHHKNLVQLLGYCDEGTNRLLVYEFMSNGTLANFLFALPRPDWNLRVRISLEIAKGLVYLHEECNVPIIHCDIKPQNILLDQTLVAKISDFGLSKLLLSDQSRTHTMVRGTRGYVAPEWFKNVAVSAKVDVYSYGVMLLEIICCRRSVEMEIEEERRAILTDWAYDCYVDGRVDVLVDEEEMAMADKCRVQKWLKIAMWCIQEDPSKRPTMKMVLNTLEGLVEVPEPPWPSPIGIELES